MPNDGEHFNPSEVKSGQAKPGLPPCSSVANVAPGPRSKSLVGVAWWLPGDVARVGVVAVVAAARATGVGQRRALVVVLAVVGEDLDGGLPVAAVGRRPAATQPPRRAVRQVAERDRVGRVLVRRRAGPRCAGVERAATSGRRRSTRCTWLIAALKLATIAETAPPLPAPPGCRTPTMCRCGEITEASARCSLSGSAVPPCASTQLASDSLAARPTAITSCRSLRSAT